MDKLNFVVRRNLRLLAEARDGLLVALRAPTPRERREARAAAVSLAAEARLAIARETGCDPRDVPWAAARVDGVELLRLIEGERARRVQGEISLDSWSESLALLRGKAEAG